MGLEILKLKTRRVFFKLLDLVACVFRPHISWVGGAQSGRGASDGLVTWLN